MDLLSINFELRYSHVFTKKCIILVSGNLETKYKCSDYGVTLTEKWNTDNTLNTTLDVQDKLMPGLKVVFKILLAIHFALIDLFPSSNEVIVRI